MASVHFLLVLVICLSASVADGLRFKAATKVSYSVKSVNGSDPVDDGQPHPEEYWDNDLKPQTNNNSVTTNNNANKTGAAPSSFASKMLALKPGSPLTLNHIKINNADTPSSGLEGTKAEGASGGYEGGQDGENTPESAGLDPEGPEPEKPTGTKTDEDVVKSYFTGNGAPSGLFRYSRELDGGKKIMQAAMVVGVNILWVTTIVVLRGYWENIQDGQFPT
ncbi:hypothetical protein FOZ62_032320 [Perkinsus olseni]|uniref:Uncharacterized protein n=1 Tax=Perkinsus olseni TaxID=32597 RepID=A0A7J6SI84_PEROL|nr:hypothetical protein FOZ62_032320 [Perkinsus olseni]